MKGNRISSILPREERTCPRSSLFFSSPKNEICFERTTLKADIMAKWRQTGDHKRDGFSVFARTWIFHIMFVG